MIADIVSFVVGAGLGFIGGFIVMKYETKAASKIQATVNDVTTTVETTANKVAADVKSTNS